MVTVAPKAFTIRGSVVVERSKNTRFQDGSGALRNCGGVRLAKISILQSLETAHVFVLVNSYAGRLEAHDMLL